MLPIVLLSLGAPADSTRADAWTGFRNNGSSVAAARGLPEAWSPRENVA
ncbi:MAG TPA: hypothetical protein VM529_14165 [Gemmata sp.]|nr:hypothetical protein [Gemmata sp.]